MKTVNIIGWQESIIELTRGLDFSSRTPVQVKDYSNTLVIIDNKLSFWFDIY